MKRLSVVFILFAVCATTFGAGAEDTGVVNVAGEWEITMTYVVGSATHTATIVQDGGKLTGDYKGGFLEGKLSGAIKGNEIAFTGRLRHEATSVRYSYKGTVDGDSIKGTVDMGEYWTADFTATRKK